MNTRYTDILLVTWRDTEVKGPIFYFYYYHWRFSTRLRIFTLVCTRYQPWFIYGLFIVKDRRVCRSKSFTVIQIDSVVSRNISDLYGGSGVLIRGFNCKTLKL